MNGPADLPEQLEALRDGGALRIAVPVDALALDGLHCEVGPVVLRQPAINEPGDARVLQPGERLAFVEEPRPHRLRFEAIAEQLERHLALELTIHPLGQKDLSHPAAPQPAEHAVRPHAAPGWIGRAGVGHRQRFGGRCPAGAELVHRPVVLMGGQ